MFEPDLDEWPWASPLLEATARGPDAVAAAARNARKQLSDLEADEVGLRLAGLLELPLDPPGHLGGLAAAARFFAGPATIAAVGRSLRAPELAPWKIAVGIGLLERNQGAPALIQLTQCACDGHDVELLGEVGRLLRGYPGALRDLLDHAHANAPLADLERYFAVALERAMVQGTRFRAQALRDAIRSPAHASLARVVWAEFHGRAVSRLFTLDPEGDGFVDADWNAVDLAADAMVGVVHPAEVALDPWGLHFADTERTGLFTQLDRPCTPSQPRLPYDRIERDVPHWDLVRFLYRNGWTRDRESRDFELAIRGATLSLATSLAERDARRLVSIHLRGGDFGRGVEDHVTYSEALAATLSLLDEFAPDLI